jgi:hypothetical protein
MHIKKAMPRRAIGADHVLRRGVRRGALAELIGS